MTEQKKSELSGKEIATEMFPYLFYAAFPIVLTIIIACTIGYTHQ
jgi:hypothetical protein